MTQHCNVLKVWMRSFICPKLPVIANCRLCCHFSFLLPCRAYAYMETLSTCSGQSDIYPFPVTMILCREFDILIVYTVMAVTSCVCLELLHV